MDYERQLAELKEGLEKSKSLKYRAEAKLEQLKSQEAEIKKELEEMGIVPENLEDEIKRLNEEVESLLEKANDMLPRDLLNGR